MPGKAVLDAQLKSLGTYAVIEALGIVREPAGIVQADLRAFPGMRAADSKAYRNAIAGVIDGGTGGIHRDAIQPGIVSPRHRHVGPEIDLATRRRARRLTARQDGGSSILREKRAN